MEFKSRDDKLAIMINKKMEIRFVGMRKLLLNNDTYIRFINTFRQNEFLSETLEKRNKELEAFREKFRGSEDAIGNILTMMLDRATAASSDKHEVSFCREESLGSSLGRKEKKFLQDLIGCENFKFIETLKKTATQEAEQKLKLRNRKNDKEASLNHFFFFTTFIDFFFNLNFGGKQFE